MAANTNYYLQRFNLNQSILRQMLASLQAAVPPLTKNNEVDWDKVSDDYGAYDTLDQNGQKQSLKLKEQYDLITSYLEDSENNLNILGLESILRFWKNEKISLSTKALKLNSLINEQFFQRETGRSALTILVDVYEHEQKEISAATNPVTTFRKDAIRRAIDEHNKSVMDPLRASLRRPEIYKNWQQLTSSNALSTSGTNAREVENFVLANLGELTAAPYQRALKSGNDDIVATSNFSERLAQLAESQSSRGVRNWAQSVASDEQATRSIVSLTQAVTSDWDARYKESHPTAKPWESIQVLNKQTNDVINFVNSRAPGAKSLEYELTASLGSIYGDEGQGKVLANNIIRETLRNAAGEQKDFRDIASTALMKAGIDPSSGNGQSIIEYLDATYGADLMILDSKARNHMDQNTSLFDRNLEASLLKKGIDPQTYRGAGSSWDNLGKELGLDTKNADTLFAETRQALSKELGSAKPDFARIHHLQQLYEHLIPDQKVGLWTQSRVFLANARGSVSSIYINSLDALYEISEQLPHNKLRNAYLEISEQIKSSIAITIKDSKGKIIERIPFFGLKFWVIDKIFTFRKTWTHTLLKSLRGKKGLLNNTFRFALRNYAKGGYSGKWMFSSITHEFLNTAAKSTGKYVSWGALKKAIAKGVVDIVSKLSVKLAASLGTAIESGGTSIVIGLILIGFDLIGMGIKWVWNNKGKVTLGVGGIGIALGSMVTSALASVQTAIGAVVNAVGSVANVIFQMITATGASLAGGIVAGGSLLLGFTFMQNVYTLPPTHIDSGVPQAPVGDVSNGCVQIAPAKGEIWQGPHGDYSHSVINAIDIRLEKDGTPIKSASDGKVVFKGYLGVYGNRVDIERDFNGKKITFIYGHLGSISVSTNQQVTAGQVIGTGDSTSSNSYFRSPHLHFEISGISSYAECAIPGTNPAKLEKCNSRESCNAKI